MARVCRPARVLYHMDSQYLANGEYFLGTAAMLLCRDPKGRAGIWPFKYGLLVDVR